MHPYQTYVREIARLTREGKNLPLGGFKPAPRPALAPDAPRVLIFSPHPDDEVIVGGLPLRLLRELGMRVINVAVTQGSNKARQAERWQELEACCAHIGFDLLQTRQGGLEHINPATRRNDPSHWAACVARIAEILTEQEPRAIFVPHDDDWNSTHIGTHHLVVDALQRAGSSFECLVIETEFWGAMRAPNLMVESSEEDASDLIAALTFHVGEVRRNPYHLRLAAWLMDNVRRGGELVGGQGGAVPDFTFATLYRRRQWQGGQFKEAREGGRFVSTSDRLDELF